jgi:hypothetical protein
VGKSPIGYEQAADWIRGNGSTVKEHFKNLSSLYLHLCLAMEFGITA